MRVWQLCSRPTWRVGPETAHQPPLHCPPRLSEPRPPGGWSRAVWACVWLRWPCPQAGWTRQSDEAEADSLPLLGQSFTDWPWSPVRPHLLDLRKQRRVDCGGLQSGPLLREGLHPSSEPLEASSHGLYSDKRSPVHEHNSPRGGPMRPGARFLVKEPTAPGSI